VDILGQKWKAQKTQSGRSVKVDGSKEKTGRSKGRKLDVLKNKSGRSKMLEVDGPKGSTMLRYNEGKG